MRDGSVVYPYHHQHAQSNSSTTQGYRSSLSLSPPASSSPSSVHRTSPMTWAAANGPQVAAAAVPPSSFEPHTPSPSFCAATGGVMDPYTAPWAPPSSEYDAPYDVPPQEDLLFVKAAPNGLPRPLHSYMAPLSLTSQPPTTLPSPPPSKRIDMRLARPGSEESKPGYLTPLASYTAQTFWYFWYADMFNTAQAVETSARRVSEDLRSSTSRPFDSEGRPRHPVHPNNFQPNFAFNQFVFSVLHSTQVSFSVTILALMYTYKYRKIQALGIRKPYRTQVSEEQGFVTGLMLANKYLDDNTYTNTTWAQFLGIPVKDVNDYELEWLDALEFNLCIRTDEFETWRAMLDAHVRSRERGDMTAPALSGGSFAASGGQGVRARSASPPLGYYSSPSGLNPAPKYALRKRSARDAFAADAIHNAGMYEAARLDPRKSSFVSLAPPLGFPQHPATTMSTPAIDTLPAASLGRSSSLNRQIARLPANGGRRDSSGQEQAVSQVMDLRHAAAANAAQTWMFPTGEAVQFDDKGQRWRFPQQPRLYFLQAAATPQFGPDGRYHKAIPHYFDPNCGAFDPSMAAPVYAAQHEMMDVDSTQSQIDLASPTDPTILLAAQNQPLQFVVPMAAVPMAAPIQHHAFIDPQPAPFANAGPPGYAYGAPGWHLYQQQQQQLQQQQLVQQQQQLAVPQQPPQWTAGRHPGWKPGHMSRWSTSSDEGYMYNLPRVPMCSVSAEYPINGY